MAVLSMGEFNVHGRSGNWSTPSTKYTRTTPTTKSNIMSVYDMSDEQLKSIPKGQGQYLAAQGELAKREKTAAPMNAARSALQKAIDQYGPEGSFGAGVKANLKRGETKAVASGMQNLARSGFANTTMAAGLSKTYQEEVAQPILAEVESKRAENIAALESQIASLEAGFWSTGMQLGQTKELAGQNLDFNYAQLGASTGLQQQQINLQANQQAFNQNIQTQQLNRMNQPQATSASWDDVFSNLENYYDPGF